ncbi:MAG TPA: hypothetical protein VGP47_05390 [Parachlamydiaceae bacterium]|nr:hypothetical protein [Parachlamydiaceae bacterium]
MKSQGIRILDKKIGIGLAAFTEILIEIKNENSFFWSILYLDITGTLGQEWPNPTFEEINDSKNGFPVDWKDLNLLANKIEQVIDITVLGCKNKNNLQRYEVEQEMYETCDIVIQMVDSSYWEVFSNDAQLIDRLTEKFKQTQFLETDFLEKMRK